MANEVQYIHGSKVTFEKVNGEHGYNGCKASCRISKQPYSATITSARDYLENQSLAYEALKEQVERRMQNREERKQRQHSGGSNNDRSRPKPCS